MVLKKIAQYKKDFLVFTLLFLIDFIFFAKNIMGFRYTLWDTNLGGFVYFLYFTDSLHSGFLPFWNPLMQSGVFFRSYMASYSLIQFPFSLLAFVINPLHAYELALQTQIFLGACGAYLFFRSYNFDKYVSVFGAVAYMLALLMPMIGESPISYSFCILPWLFLIINKIILKEESNLWKIIFFSILAGMLMVCGYPWHDVVNFTLLVCYTVILFYSRKSILQTPKKIMVFSFVSLVLIFITYGLLRFPYYLSVLFNYSHLGNFVNSSEILRGIDISTQKMSYPISGGIISLVCLIDARMVMKIAPIFHLKVSTWFVGAGWVVWIIFIFIFFSKIRLRLIEKFWLFIGIIFTVYALAPGGVTGYFLTVIHWIPLLGSNRWLFLGIAYTEMAIIFIAIYGLNCFYTKRQDLILINKKHKLNSILLFFSIYFVLMLFLIIFHFGKYQYDMVTLTVLSMWFVFSNKKRMRTLGITFLMAINILSFYSLYYEFPSKPWKCRNANGPNICGEDKDYILKVKNRNKNISVLHNWRRLGYRKDYDTSDEQWVFDKVPFSQGYDPQGDPLYWYVKDEPFLTKIVDVKQEVRTEAVPDRQNYIFKCDIRSIYPKLNWMFCHIFPEKTQINFMQHYGLLKSGNEFANAVITDITKDLTRPTVSPGAYQNIALQKDFHYQIKNFLLTPNRLTLKVNVSGPSYVIFYNNYYPSWHVILDDQKAQMARINHLFMGVYVPTAGEHRIVFIFRPILTYICLLIPYLALLISGLLLFFTQWKKIE